jgi:hypothetical protein
LPYTHFVVLVILRHASLALWFRDDFPSILDNNLACSKASVGANPVAAVLGLDDLDSNAILASLGPPFVEICKCTVVTKLGTNSAVPIVTLIEHHSIIAVVATSSLFFADAARIEVSKVLRLLPQRSSIADKAICIC